VFSRDIKGPCACRTHVRFYRSRRLSRACNERLRRIPAGTLPRGKSTRNRIPSCLIGSVSSMGTAPGRYRKSIFMRDVSARSAREKERQRGITGDARRNVTSIKVPEGFLVLEMFIVAVKMRPAECDTDRRSDSDSHSQPQVSHR